MILIITILKTDTQFFLKDKKNSFKIIVYSKALKKDTKKS